MTNLLQIPRAKIFRAVSSITSNPSAVDRRGKAPKSKTSFADTEFVKEFLRTFPTYESTINPKSIDTKYFHPKLTLKAIYRLYENTCHFEQKAVLTYTVFERILKQNFVNLHPFKSSKSICHDCSSIREERKRKMIAQEVKEAIQKKEDDHLTNLRDMKNSFIQCSREQEPNVDVFTFELQQPLGMPLLPIEESYDIKQLWFSNMCVFDVVHKKAKMYVFDETIAKRGPEEVAYCILQHIACGVAESTKKVILYSDASGLYRSIEMILLLRKFFDYAPTGPDTIEQRFFSQAILTTIVIVVLKSLTKKLKQRKICLHQAIGLN